MLIQPTGWLIDLVRNLLANIDTLLFRILSYTIQLIFDIANFSLTSSDTLKFLYSKIYVVLTVYMVFKLSFTFFNYIVNPEAMSDDKQGVNKIIRNAVIMVLLLIILPGIFTGKVLGNGTDNLIVRIQKAATPILTQILLPDNGEQVKEENGKLVYDNSRKTADAMALTIAKIFYHPAYKTYELVCKGSEPKRIDTIDDLTITITQGCKKDGGKSKSGDYKEKKFYKYSYVYLVSTLITCFMIYLLIKMAVLVGKRTFKLIILEIIFPIPVMMLIDPGALDSRDSPFKAWLHEFVMTFLELYFQLATLYLFLNLIKILMDAFTELELTSGTNFDNLLLELALIISLVFFVGEMPVFIRKALGVKPEDDIHDEMGALAGAAVGFGVGKATGAVKSGVNSVVQGARHVGGGVAATIASGVASAKNGGSFGEGANAGLKRYIGYDSNKSYKDNAKDHVKERINNTKKSIQNSRVGRAYSAVKNKYKK